MLDAAKAMKLSAKDLLELQIIDEIISEPIGGAHRDKNKILENVKNSIGQNLDLFTKMSGDEILMQRKNKFLKIGRDKGFINNPEEISDLKNVKNKYIFYLQSLKINKMKFFISLALILMFVFFYYSL